MNKTTIAKALVVLVFLGAVFATGLYVGRTGGPGGFTVTTQYAVGAVDEAELDALARREEAMVERTERQEEQSGAETGPAQPAASEPAGGLVNINTASAEELQILPGVGPAIAERIISHREASGPFRIIEEITDVSGIGPARFSEIRDLIRVE